MFESAALIGWVCFSDYLIDSNGHIDVLPDGTVFPRLTTPTLSGIPFRLSRFNFDLPYGAAFSSLHSF